ncbi:hypothetical protein RirG_045470 [Rhizophagus irregularis DAOM 197198w]|uniref:Uncharacterized protein n=1 Tax=Rhizophagus irregularis (strain DAOM 197198w) TaxID=1432141 RepID=A0A015N755_RHIIW|nr:hypothetical protein RirG_045470 [Rhizophagus irregularis DAOM 197198w]
MLEIATGGERAAGDVAYPRFQMTLPEVEAEMVKIRTMKTIQHMVSQYGRTFEALKEIAGGREEALRILGDAFERIPEAIPDPNDLYQDLYRPTTQH